MSDRTPAEQRLSDVFAGVPAPDELDGYPGRPVREFRTEAAWLRPVAGLAAVAILGAAVGGYFGIRAALNGGPAAGSAAAPPARSGAAMAYDASNGTVVLFGGVGVHGGFDDTWTWDGSTWTEQHPAKSPPASSGAQMAYDPVSHHVILVGGSAGLTPGGVSGSITCTGSASGSAVGSEPGGAASPSTPTPTPATPPSPGATRSGSPGTGCTEAPHQLPTSAARTWIWDGSGWSSARGPQPDLGGERTLILDPASGRVLLIDLIQGIVAQPMIGCPVPVGSPADLMPACILPPSVAQPPPVQQWTGTAWVTKPSSGSLTAPGDLGLGLGGLVVDDPVSGRLAEFTTEPVAVCGSAGSGSSGSPGSSGSSEGSSGNSSSSTSSGMPATTTPATTTPATTTPATPRATTTPAPTASGPPATPPAVSVPPVCTGIPPTGARPGAERLWTGSGWGKPVTFTSGPVIGGEAVMVGDPATRSDVLIEAGATWVWSGSWTQAHPADRPHGASPLAAYDGATRQVVLFGGLDASGSGEGPTNQTWTWDGSNWTLRAGSVTPPATYAVPSPAPLPTSPSCNPYSPAIHQGNHPLPMCPLPATGAPLAAPIK